MDFADLFVSEYNAKIARTGARELLDWLSNDTDFFTAPASTRFHLNYEGGLVEHSVHVYQRLLDLCQADIKNTHGASASLTDEDEESIAIIGLLHDVCKANFYAQETRRYKDPATGVWGDRLQYVVRDTFPLGHGEKSLYLIQRYMLLSDQEALAIRWHMGFSDNDYMAGGRNLDNTLNISRLTALTTVADFMAAQLDESDTSLDFGDLVFS